MLIWNWNPARSVGERSAISRWSLTRTLILLFLSGFMAAHSWACSFFSFDEKRLDQAVSEYQHIVLGRVMRVQATFLDDVLSEGQRVPIAQVAHVQVMQRFKGVGGSLRLKSDLLACGWEFTQGEEKVFFVFDGRVSLADAHDPAPWLIQGLKERCRFGRCNPQTKRTGTPFF